MMDENNKEIEMPKSQDTPDLHSGDTTDHETTNRRELIARYGKYALVSASLLTFVSKAKAIHSKP